MIKSLFKISGLGIFASTISQYYDTKSDCCGIIGYIGHKPIAFDVITEGINLLQNRGYDSAGIATISKEKILIDKMISNFDNGIDCI